MRRSSPHLKLLEYLAGYLQQHGYAPVIDEMMVALKKSRSAIQHSLKCLEQSGHIERQPGKARAIKILQPVQDGIPIWGTIAAGYLTEVFTENRDILPITSPKLKLEDFALQVVGDSMVGDHIPDGSFVIMRPVSDTGSLKNGEIVAAYVEGRGTTLKHIYRKEHHVSLVASNPNYLPIEIDTNECRVDVQGLLLMVWREC